MKFRKKPIVIEAAKVSTLVEQATNAWEELPVWFRRAYDSGGIVLTPDAVLINTLEGTMPGDIGDWIIRGAKGELYPCKPEIFADIYEAVSE